MSKRRGLEVVPEHVLFPNSSPDQIYQAEFEEEEQEDIITIRVPDPKTAYYYDEQGTEKIELRETDPQSHYFHEEGNQEVFVAEGVLSEEEMLKEADRFRRSNSP